jgi:hemoglobin-like flavoprotein
MLCSAQLKSHGNNVFEAVNAAVNSLDKTDSLNSLLTDLGRRHVAYGAKIHYFPVKLNINFVKL